MHSTVGSVLLNCINYNNDGKSSGQKWKFTCHLIKAFLPIVSVLFPWRHQKTFGFLMFSGASKGDIGKKALKHTAWKVSVFVVFLVRIFPHTDQKNSEYGHFSRSGYAGNSLTHFMWMISFYNSLKTLKNGLNEIPSWMFLQNKQK